MANKIKMKIGGIEYCITSDYDEAYIRSLGAELERKMQTIMQKSPFLSTTMAAVMVALDSLDEKKKTENENEHLRLDIKRLLEEAARTKLEAESAYRRLSEIEGRLNTGSKAYEDED